MGTTKYCEINVNILMGHLFGDVEPLINCNHREMYEMINLENVNK